MSVHTRRLWIKPLKFLLCESSIIYSNYFWQSTIANLLKWVTSTGFKVLLQNKWKHASPLFNSQYENNYHPSECTQLKAINLTSKVCMCPSCLLFILKQLSVLDLWYQCCLCSFLRLNLTRWMRRTRPTPWYLWLPSHRNPLTSRLSTASLRQKMGPTPTPTPRLTDTLPARRQWLTLRCESYRGFLHYLSPARTHYTQAILLPQRPSMKSIWKVKMIPPHLPSSSFQPASLWTMITMTMTIACDTWP